MPPNQHMTVMITIDPSSTDDFINPLMLDVLNMQEDDGMLGGEPAGSRSASSQRLIALVRITCATSPGDPIEAARPTIDRPTLNHPHPAMPYFDTPVSVAVGPEGDYDIIIGTRTAHALGYSHLLAAFNAERMARYFAIPEPRGSSSQQRAPPPPSATVPASAIRQQHHAEHPQPPATAPAQAPRRPNWDEVQRGYEGERCPSCGDRTDTQRHPHDPRSCNRNRNLYPPRTVAEEALLRDLDNTDRAQRLAQRPQQSQPQASFTPSRQPQSGLQLAPVPPRPQGQHSSPPANTTHTPSISRVQPTAYPATTPFTNSNHSTSLNTANAAPPTAHNQPTPSDHRPSFSPPADRRLVDIEHRLLSFERSNAAMQTILADLHADMRSRSSGRSSTASHQFQHPQSGRHDWRPSDDHHEPGVDLPAPMRAPPSGMGLYPVPDISVLGNMKAFDAFLQAFWEYRSKAADAKRSAVPLAYCFKDTIHDLASVFTAMSKKRGHIGADAPRSWTAEQLSQLDDESFVRLFRELCADQLDRPSQIIEALAQTRADLVEGQELAYILRLVRAFREQLLRIPPHAFAKCTEEQVRDAFLRAVFKQDWLVRAPDYVHCPTWEETREALIQSATDQTLSLRALATTVRPNDDTFETKYRDALANLDPLIADFMLPEERASARSWEARYNELSRRIRHARSRLRAAADSAEPRPNNAVSSQRPDSRPRPPEAQTHSAPQAQSPNRNLRDPSPTDGAPARIDGRSTPRPRFPDGSCYRCGREGHRANDCKEQTDIHGAQCIDRQRQRSLSRESGSSQ